MATSTKPAKKPKPKRQPARAAETNGHAKPAAKNGAVHATQKTFDWERPEAMDSDVLYLTPSQFAPSGSNPRRNASQASIDELAQSIKEVGLVQPITVRPVNGKHEIVAGERRYHAAKRAGLRDIPVIVRDLDDQQAAALRCTENLQRQDLSPIEEAEAFAQLTRPTAEGGCGWTQTEAAKRLGVTQGHVSNRLRLLSLPPTIQSKVISGEITATQARALLPFLDAGATALEAVLTRSMDELYPNASEREVKRDCCLAVGEELRPIDVVRYGPWLGGKVRQRAFKPAEEQLERLDVVKLPTGDKGKLERWARNVALWDELQAAAIAAKETKQKSGGKAKVETKDGKRPEPTAAEQRAKRAEAQRVLDQRIERIRADWCRHLIAHGGLCAAAKAKPETYPIPRLMLFLACRAPHHAGDRQRTLIREVCEAKCEHDSAVKLWARLAAVDADQLAERNLRGLEELFWTQQGAAEEFDDATVIEIAKCLSIDLAAAWKAKQMGPLTEAFFAAHSTEQLLDGVADGWGWKMSHLSSAEADLTTLKKWELVEWCIETAKSKPLPPCLELPRTGRGRRPKK